MIRIGTIALLVVLGTSATVYALDHKNLDEGRPVRLEDAYPIAHGEFAIEAGAGFTLQRRGADRAPEGSSRKVVAGSAQQLSRIFDDGRDRVVHGGLRQCEAAA